MSIYNMERREMRQPSGYDVAQVCLNGHVITGRLRAHPQFRKDHCTRCGEVTIYKCDSCADLIQGEFHTEGVISMFVMTDPPAFCHGCGKPYPWTRAKISAAKAMADELDGLTDADKILLKSSIDDISADKPMTAVAVTRFKKLLPKMGDLAEGMKKLVVDVASKTAAELLKGGGQ